MKIELLKNILKIRENIVVIFTFELDLTETTLEIRITI